VTPPGKGQKSLQKRQFILGPKTNLHNIIGTRHHSTESNQQYLLKGIQHLPALAWILKG
jgi:hypothetical protein